MYYKTIIRHTISYVPLMVHRLRNHNHTMSIISRDCIGGVIYHQYGLKFLSPTINLSFSQLDFMYFCLHLKEYITCDIVEAKTNYDYVCGLLKPANEHLPPLIVRFHHHYDSFESAKQKWNERKKRINWNNIYVINSCAYPGEVTQINEEVITLWNKIPYKKVVFVDSYKGFDDEYIINQKINNNAYLLLYKSRATWKRVFNDFNLNRFLNH